MDTPSNEPGPLHLAPAAGDGVLPPVVPDSVPVLTTLPGSAPLSLIVGVGRDRSLCRPEFWLLTRWDGLVDLESRPWARRGPARRGRPARLSRHRRDRAPPDRHARCSSARQRRVLDLPVRGLVRVGPGGLARARRKLLPCRVAVFDPGLLDGTCDRARCSARRFWCIRDGACWTGVTRELVKNILPWPCGSACDGTGLSPSVTTRGDNPLSVCRARTLPMGRLGTSLMRLCDTR